MSASLERVGGGPRCKTMANGTPVWDYTMGSGA